MVDLPNIVESFWEGGHIIQEMERIATTSLALAIAVEKTVDVFTLNLATEHMK